MTIQRFLPKWALLAPISFALGNLGGGADAHAQASGQAIATISNGLPVDGCSYPVTINGVQYAPDPESIAAIDDQVPAGGELRVRIRYHLTGETGVVECGFGTSRELPEISFTVIRVLPSTDSSEVAPPNM